MKNNYAKLPIFHFAKKLSFFQNTHSKKALIFGNFGAMNQGDEAILAGELTELSKYAPHVKPTIISRYPEQITHIHGKNVSTIALRAPLSIIMQILSSQIIIVGGGGLFCRVKDGLTGYIYQIYFMLLCLLLPKLLGKKICVIGIGIYKNMGKFNLKLALNLLKIADIVTVRDSHSDQLLSDHLVPHNYYKDNSYLMNLPNQSIDSKKKIKVGISLRMPFNESEKNTLFNDLSRFIELNQLQCNFYIFELDIQPNRINDHYVTNDLLKRCSKKAISSIDVVKYAKYTHPSDVFSGFTDLDFFIAMRLHSMIFADRCKVPFFGIPYDIKCESFIDSTGAMHSKLDVHFAEKLQVAFTNAMRNN